MYITFYWCVCVYDTRHHLHLIWCSYESEWEELLNRWYLSLFAYFICENVFSNIFIMDSCLSRQYVQYSQSIYIIHYGAAQVQYANDFCSLFFSVFYCCCWKTQESCIYPKLHNRNYPYILNSMWNLILFLHKILYAVCEYWIQSIDIESCVWMFDLRQTNQKVPRIVSSNRAKT